MGLPHTYLFELAISFVRSLRSLSANLNLGTQGPSLKCRLLSGDAGCAGGGSGARRAEYERAECGERNLVVTALAPLTWGSRSLRCAQPCKF